MRHRFTVRGKRYVYDAVSSNIVEIGEALNGLLRICRKSQYTTADFCNLSVGNDVYRHVQTLFADSTFSSEPANIVNPVKHDAFFRNLARNSSAVTLCLTERCSLRCKYCPYTSNTGSRRHHSPESMRLPTAKAAIDFLYDRLSPEESPLISFYGGEPLLEYETLKRAVAYAKKRFVGRELHFAVTTNFTVLEQSMIEFFIKNRFMVYVSLDGPEDLHDRYRKGPDGKGSFRLVMDSLNTLQLFDPEYFVEKVRINMVLAPPLDLDSVNTFIRNELPLPRSNFSVSLVDTSDTDFFNEICYESSDDKQLRRYRRIAEKAFGCDLFDQYPLAALLYRKGIVRIATRSRWSTSGKLYIPTGQCYPASFKSFVDIHGNVHMCEKIDEGIPIGDVFKGVSEQSVESLIGDYYEDAVKTCASCFAQRICGLCIAPTIVNGRFDTDTKRQVCSAIRDRLHRNLCSYIRVMQENPDAFKNLSDQSVNKPFLKIIDEIENGKPSQQSKGRS